jgi:hypothetical protein
MFASCSSTYGPSARRPDSTGRRLPPRRGLHAALGAVLSLLVIAIAAASASAQQQNWPCDAFGYLFQTQAGGTTSEIVQVDIPTGVQSPIGNTPQTVNAVGYNIVDGFY